MKDVHISQEAYLRSIIDAIDRIAAHQNSNAASDTMNRAIVFEIVSIGEACSKLSSSLREKYPSVAWAKIIGTRNRLVHGYIEIDFVVVGNIVKNFIPEFRKAIESVIQKEWGNNHG